jgi:hypothetical protein
MDFDVSQIIGWLGTIIFGTLGAKYWAKVKKIMGAAKELADVFIVLNEVTEDKKLDPPEVDRLKKELNEFFVKIGVGTRV